MRKMSRTQLRKSVARRVSDTQVNAEDSQTAPGSATDAAVDYQAMVDAFRIKQRIGRQTVVGAVLVGKCINPATGEPVSARREETAVLPVEGSQDESVDGNGRGRCPLCGARVALSKKGFLTAHSMKNVPVPAPKPTVRLAERQTEVTESGARTGSPDAAQRARSAELSGAALRDWHPPLVWRENVPTVRIQMRKPVMDPDGKPVLGKNGKPRFQSETVAVPATEENIRTALRQEQHKKMRKCKKTGQMTGGPDKALLVKLGGMLRGATGLQAVGALGAARGTFKVFEACTFDEAESVDGRVGSQRDVRARVKGMADPSVPTLTGVAMVQGRAMPPVEPVREGKNGKPRNAAGWSGGVGRERPDRIAVQGSDPSVCNGRKGKPCTVEGCVAIVGGHFGDATCAEFRTWTVSHRKRYWKAVTGAKKYAARASEWSQREESRTQKMAAQLRAKGESLPTCGW